MRRTGHSEPLRFSLSRRAYSHGGNTLLTVQIDAAINPGNSGGPAFSDVEARLIDWAEAASSAFSDVRMRLALTLRLSLPFPVPSTERQGRRRGLLEASPLRQHRVRVAPTTPRVT